MYSVHCILPSHAFPSHATSLHILPIIKLGHIRDYGLVYKDTVDSDASLTTVFTTSKLNNTIPCTYLPAASPLIIGYLLCIVILCSYFRLYCHFIVLD